MKNRIYILLFLTVLSFMWFSVGDKEDFEAGYKQIQYVFVEPLETPETEYTVRSVLVEPHEKKDMNILEGILGTFLLIAILCSIVCFIGIVWSVIRKKKVFIRQNVDRMRIIAYTLIISILYVGVEDYFLYRQARQLVEIPGYETEMYKFPFGSLLLVLFFAVLTEIYAQGVQMDEEQELTV